MPNCAKSRRTFVCTAEHRGFGSQVPVPQCHHRERPNTWLGFGISINGTAIKPFAVKETHDTVILFSVSQMPHVVPHSVRLE